MRSYADKILAAIAEADRFKAAANRMLVADCTFDRELREHERGVKLYENGEIPNRPFYPIDHRGKANAAMKRASMDLTRVLADLRNWRIG